MVGCVKRKPRGWWFQRCSKIVALGEVIPFDEHILLPIQKKGGGVSRMRAYPGSEHLTSILAYFSNELQPPTGHRS